MSKNTDCNADVNTSAENSFTDSRDGSVYRTVKIGEQVWLAENFRYNCEGSYAYDDDKKKEAKYGRFYTWDAAMKCIPEGWHLPTRDEFRELERWVAAHTDNKVATALKSTTDDWNEDEDTPKGTDEFGFCALPSGYRDFKNIAESVGECEFACFWSASEVNSDAVICRSLNFDLEGFDETWEGKKDAHSVRLVRD